MDIIFLAKSRFMYIFILVYLKEVFFNTKLYNLKKILIWFIRYGYNSTGDLTRHIRKRSRYINNIAFERDKTIMVSKTFCKDIKRWGRSSATQLTLKNHVNSLKNKQFILITK